MKAHQVARSAILACAIAAFVVAIADERNVVQQMTPKAVQLRIEGEFPSLGGATEWLNSPPLTAAGLRGKVVLIDFWTYSCINWRRSLPYVRAWAEKYRNRGLVVIGVHSPEFEFEKNADNVRWAVNDMRIDYPIAIDSDQAIWRAFRNDYWPALYFIDAQGHIRHHQFGEGEYEKSERIIQQLLAEAGVSGIGHELVSVDAPGAEAAADWGNLRSPESYVGHERTENFVSRDGAILDKPHVYKAPAQLRLNHWALSGDWTIGKQAVVLNKADGRIAYRFHARDLNLILGPSARGASVRFRVLIDGQPPGAAHGVDRSWRKSAPWPASESASDGKNMECTTEPGHVFFAVSAASAHDWGPEMRLALRRPATPCALGYACSNHPPYLRCGSNGTTSVKRHLLHDGIAGKLLSVGVPRSAFTLRFLS